MPLWREAEVQPSKVCRATGCRSASGRRRCAPASVPVAMPFGLAEAGWVRRRSEVWVPAASHCLASTSPAVAMSKRGRGSARWVVRAGSEAQRWLCILEHEDAIVAEAVRPPAPPSSSNDGRMLIWAIGSSIPLGKRRIFAEWSSIPNRDANNPIHGRLEANRSSLLHQHSASCPELP